MQGEKGIGRFAIHKLGDYIEIHTKALNQKEAQLILDFTEYDKGNQLDLFTTQEEIDANYKFLDQIKNKWFVNATSKKLKKASGTIIHIKNIRDNWTSNDLILLEKIFFKSYPPIIPTEDRNLLDLKQKLVTDFKIKIF
ncbi:MAG: hypothetical protein IPK10_15800 [Bacteroidetes bacterium]|nr:hypothetical protein [Bacteroidota bacterium]